MLYVIDASHQHVDGGVPPDKVLHFPDAIPGFPGARDFALTDLDDAGAFQVLQSLDDPDLSMVVAVPWPYFPDYAPELPDEVQEQLELAAPGDAIVFCAVTVDPEEEAVFMNLLGPFVVNRRTRRGRQVVLADLALPVRASLQLAG